MNDLKNKVIVVTGASTGIGAAVAAEFGRLGASVVVHYFSSPQAAHSRAIGRHALVHTHGSIRYRPGVCGGLSLPRLDEMSAYVTGQIIEVNGGQYMP